MTSILRAIWFRSTSYVTVAEQSDRTMIPTETVIIVPVIVLLLRVAIPIADRRTGSSSG